MRFRQFTTLCVALIFSFNSVDSLAASKTAKAVSSQTSGVKSTKKAKSVKKSEKQPSTSSTKKGGNKTVKAKTGDKDHSSNHTKMHYGVRGAKLQPTKVSNKTYRYQEKGKTHQTIGKEASRQYSQVGTASYYGGMFHGRKTASGDVFNENGYTAAHKTLALGSYALVTNLRNGRKVIVKINDRGPFSKDRIIDLSKGSAREIGMLQSGISKVRVEALQVDSQGYISGKGAQTLYQLAKKEGLPLKVKQENGDLAFKAPEQGVKKAKQTKSTSKVNKANKSSVKNAKNSKSTSKSPSKKVGKKAKKVTQKPLNATHKKTVKTAKKATKNTTSKKK